MDIKKDIIQSVVESLDGTEEKLFPYLPFLLQDSWELGSSADMVLKIVKELSLPRKKKIKILDLGCGKGAVSIPIARSLGYYIHGIDAVPEFIQEARIRAKENGVKDFCHFETGDIRVMVHSLKHYDILILGSIGPVFGNIKETLRKVSPALNKGGYLLLDDGYVEDENTINNLAIPTRSQVLEQIQQASMVIIKEEILGKEEIRQSNDHIFQHMKKRADELIQQFPEQKELFINYMKVQAEENERLENQIVCSLLVLKKHS